MPEISAIELYRYRAHRVLSELPDYRRLLRGVKLDGIKEPIEVATDGKHVVIEDGHKRVQAAIELGIKRVPITIVEREFSRTRRIKYPLGPEITALLSKGEPGTDVLPGKEDISTGL